MTGDGGETGGTGGDRKEPRSHRGTDMEKETEILVERINRFSSRLQRMFILESVPFTAEYSRTHRPVFFEKRLDGDYEPIAEGEKWGSAWESAWFRLSAQAPAGWKGSKLVAHLDFSGEGLVFSPDGKALQGITNGSIFDPDFARTFVPLEDECDGGETIELWVEAAANSLFGVFQPEDPEEDAPDRYGHFEARVESMKLAVFDEEIRRLWLDVTILAGLVKRLPEKSVRRARVIRALNGAVNAFGGKRDNAGKAREILRPELEKPAGASALEVTAVGHAHIDTAWLWPVRETVRKCARTFASQLALIDRYPGYVFGASQPQHYAFVKKHYPEIYSRVKKAHEAGRWELQGGMWVEADCNLISGESMIRQILHGKNFFLHKFGVDVKNLWLPDVFGFSPSLPQIMKKSGIDYFLTQKLSWNQFNEFPHHTFNWRGIDGSEVLAHFPPENTYNSRLDTEFLLPAAENFREKDFLDGFISLFGVGDGGGGPKEENIELGLRMKNLEDAPQVKMGTAEGFFEKLKSRRHELETWVGELYLEIHRGTYTTQAEIKKNNRLLEQKLRAVEFLWSCLPLDRYPSSALDSIWKKVLINQFHDIIPGTSINRVNVTTRQEQAQALQDCDELLSRGAEAFFTKSPGSLVLMNLLHDSFTGPLALPESWGICGAVDSTGKNLPVQVENGRTVALVNVAPYSFRTLVRTDSPVASPINGAEKGSTEAAGGTRLLLENDRVRYEFEKDGTLVAGFDKEAGRNILEVGRPGNVFTLYEDRPNNWDAWDIDFFYMDAALETAETVTAAAAVSGVVRKGLRFELSIGGSKILQEVTLAAGSKRLDFETTVDWREKHGMLRVAFPVNVQSDHASFDIQYGYMKRPTHRNTSWDRARFEVIAHRYADLSDNDYGVALLNNCKYGIRLQDNVLDLNLLRSPCNPDPDADIGVHTFTYSLYPHAGDLIRSDVISQAAQLNQGLIQFEGYRSESEKAPWRLSGEGVSLESVKKAENEDCLILRIVETLGRRSEGFLHLTGSGTRLTETDLLEWKNGEEYSCTDPVEMNLAPFEIRTYKYR